MAKANRNEGSETMRMWGAILKCFRLAAGLSHEDVARYVGYSASLIISVERGIRLPSETFVVKADEICKANGVLVKAAEHLGRDRLVFPGDTYLEEEGRARMVWAYDTHVLHPLLRTEAYTRAVLWAHCPALPEEEIEARIGREVARQARLAADQGCAFSFIVEESVLRRRTGGSAAMREQLAHLADVVDRHRTVTLQILPATHAAHAGLSGPMALLQGPEYVWHAFVDLHGAHYPMLGPASVTALHDRFTHLRSLALTPADSMELIRGLIAELG